MKNFVSRTLSILALSMLLIVGVKQKVKAQDVTVSYQSFYDNLSPYGQWINDPSYGNVWVPNEDGDFRPYGSRGHWVMTDYGNTWVSDDPWGWAVYHYGRWTYNSYYGWVWVPGYEWAPAWVSWRYGGGYSGWAPLGPGMSVDATYNYPDSWWIFVSPQYMYQPNCIHYWRGPSYNTGYIRQTTVINNYYVDNGTHVRYNYGPRRDVIEQTTHQPVQVYKVSQLNRPGAPSISRNTVSLYRPSVNRNTVGTARPTQVMQAPKPIGRNPQPANAATGNRQPAFRQEIQKQAAQNPGRGNQPAAPPRANEPARQQAQPNNLRQPVNNQPNRPQTAPQPQQPARQQPQPQPNRQQPPMRQQPPQQPMRQPEPTRQQPQQPVRPQPAPQPQREQRQPEPMRQQPPQQPMRQQPPQQPMRQPEPMRQQPPQQPMRQQPMPQQPRPQPAPPHEEGGGRR